MNILLMACMLLMQDGAAKEEAPKDTPEEKINKISYVMGNQFGKNLGRDGVEINLDLFTQGVTDGLEGKSQFEEAEMMQILRSFQMELRAKAQEKQKIEAEKQKKLSEEFLASNKAKSEVTTTETGLQYKVITAGTGEMPKADDKVTVHYRGTLIDGTEFDSSYKRNQPATFPVKGVIAGWTEALQLMKKGAKWQLVIPAKLGYGANGAPPNIPGNATLIFEVELLDIEGASAASHDGHDH